MSGAGDPPAVVLVGLPGVGKSTVGAAVAEHLGWAFLDLDREIERREGRTIARIFAEAGEARFRELEREATRELVGRRRIVVAPGGGWAAQPGLVALLRPHATIIYLAASPAAVARRLGAGQGDRPLLATGDTVDRLAALLAERAPHYRAADHVIDTELIDAQGVVDMVRLLATAPGGR